MEKKGRLKNKRKKGRKEGRNEGTKEQEKKTKEEERTNCQKGNERNADLIYIKCDVIPN